MTWEVEHLGPHTLYRGDCREVLPTLADVDAVIMDPPYGVNLQGKTHPGKFSANSVTRATVRYADSPTCVDALIAPLMAWTIGHSQRAVVLSGHRMLWVYPPAHSMGCIFQSNAAGRDRWGFGGFTPILYYGKCPYGATRPNSFQSWHPGMHVTGEAWIDHPCPKPLSWMHWLVDRGSLPGETVCDPVMGSGTTGVACVQLGRVFVGIEVERHFFDIACQRMYAALAQPDLFVPTPVPVQQRLLQEVR